MPRNVIGRFANSHVPMRLDPAAPSTSMTDEAGEDSKIVAAPAHKVFAHYDHINDLGDVPQHWRDRIAHFFEHYKDLEKGKWAKVEGWEDAAAARKEILECVARYQDCPEKPAF